MENTVIELENAQDLFSKLLYAALEDDNSDAREKCLITGDNLEHNCIKMTCNHRFNYEAIMNEIKAQKIKKSLKKIEEKEKKHTPNVEKKMIKKNPLTTKKK